MKKLFGLGPDVIGDGKVLFEWSPKGNFLAIAGSKVSDRERQGQHTLRRQPRASHSPLSGRTVTRHVGEHALPVYTRGPHRLTVECGCS